MVRTQINSFDPGKLEGLPETGIENASESYPLSFAQESLLFVKQLLPGTPIYNLPDAWVLKGRVDEIALQRSLDEIVRRHETLRTVFKSCDGKPEQVILG